MAPAEWESAVAWTINLHGNSLLFVQADASTIRTFREALESRTKESVDMETINWIWDSYADLCHGGKRYQRFRKQMNDEIASGGGNWCLDVE